MPRAFIYPQATEALTSVASDNITDATAVGVALLTATDASEARTALELSGSAFSGDYDDLTNKPTLGDAAAKNTGTSAGTLAAGDDSRITGAAQKSSNLSDLASASTARTNLGLGGAAVLAVGTTTGTVAAGDDSRITGAAQKSADLSDLASAATARTNLGLGTAAEADSGDFATASHTHAGTEKTYYIYWNSGTSSWGSLPSTPNPPSPHEVYGFDSTRFPTATDPSLSFTLAHGWFWDPAAEVNPT